jgi:ankyrin repeat protein
MRARLGKLPLGLQTAYDELYEQIQQQEGSGGIVAQRAIKWVMCSYWPLTTEELLGAVCQNPDDDDVASPVDIDDADFVLSATRNLLVIDPDRGTWKFAHLSVQEYFEDMHRVYGKREWSYYRVHAVAAKVCLLLLNDLSLDGRHDPAATDDDAATPNISLREMSDVSECGADKTGSSGASRGDNSRVKDDDAEAADDDADERASVESEAPNLVQMLTYAKWSWVYHVQQHGEDDIDPRVTTLLQQFLGSMDVSGLRYQDWNRSVVRFVYVDIGDRDVQRSQVWLSDLKPPTVASLAICRLGFYRVLGHWWQAGFRDANVRNNRGATLLMLAAKANNVDIATRLLRDGADVYARDDGGRDALAWASSVGSESVVRLLLDYGQDANQVGSYDSALCQAARFGTRSIVRLLLDRGADANAKDDGGNALQKAAYYGKTSIVELLLDRGANINAEGGSYGCALQSASVLGEVATVRLLLDRGADVNAGGGEYGSALQAASARGEVATARLLLDRGADVNAGGGRCGNALQAAAAYGDEATVQLLLDRGADVDAQGGPYGSALQAASVRGRESTVRLLLDRGANVNAQGGELGSALQAASVYHPETIVRLLLDRGADVNAQGGEYGSALQAAACNFWATDVVRLLLERGADVTLRGGKYGSALAAAIAKRNEEIETILRRHGATETED